MDRVRNLLMPQPRAQVSNIRKGVVRHHMRWKHAPFYGSFRHGAAKRHPFRAQIMAGKPGRHIPEQMKEDIRLFFLSFTAFFVCFSTFIW